MADVEMLPDDEKKNGTAKTRNNMSRMIKVIKTAIAGILKLFVQWQGPNLMSVIK
jgi:hypothetical protein